jgi:uncharacterized protein YcgI (DUF1989 family)
MILTEAEKAEIAAHTKRYNELKAAGQERAPRALPPPTARDGAPIADNSIIRREIIPGGWYWTTRLDRGDTLRIVNSSGASSVSLLAWNSPDTSERLNHADTIKVQWAARLQKGRVLLSDMGRALFSITEDTSAAHDAVVGGSTAATNEAKYGKGSFRNTRENFILAAGKLGLDRRDVTSCVTFFAPRWIYWWRCRTVRTRSIPPQPIRRRAWKSSVIADQRRLRTICAVPRARNHSARLRTMQRISAVHGKE